jgi:membrane protease subunit HflK
MPWSNQGGSGGGPWSGGGGRGPVGGAPPPDLEEMLRKGQERVRRMMPGGIGGSYGVLVILGVVVLLWLFSGVYRVQPDEQGVELMFGRYYETTLPGLNYHFPYPIQDVETPKVTRVNSIDIGFTSAGDVRARGIKRDISEESLMLTGDQNIIDIDFTVFWRIKDAGDYLFNIREPEQTVKIAAESVMREIIGRTEIQPALTEARQEIEQATKDLLQKVLDDYEAGIAVTQIQLQEVRPPEPVADAFDDVQRARQDLERLRNEAEAYRNDIIPRARGAAEQLLQEAHAYKEEVVKRSQGDAERFLAVYAQFKLAKDVTTQRLYLEAMEEILGRTNKIIIDKAGQGGPGVVPYLPLPEIQKRRLGQTGTGQTSKGQTQ